MVNDRSWQLSILVVIACLFGGGGVAYGLSNLVVQFVALAILAANGSSVRRFFTTAPKPLVILVAASVALPLLQIVPLPPGLIAGLPGRDLVTEAFAAASYGGWSPLSVDRIRTLVAATGLIAPLTLIVIGHDMALSRLGRLPLIIVGMGLLQLLPGAVQVVGQPGTANLYPELPMPGVLFGTFANRNATGIFLDCALIMLAALPQARPFSMASMAKVLTATLLVIGVLLTQSRTSMVLLALPATFATLKLVMSRFEAGAARPDSLKRPLQALLAVAIAIAAVTPFMVDSRLQTSFARFERTEDRRTDIWEDARFAASRYWPAGAGMGTFDEVIQLDETLETLTNRRAGRAHNDFIEIAIEAGAFGLGLVAAWALWIFVTSWQAIGTPARWFALAGTTVFAAIALQSCLDYPLRNQTMLCVAAIAITLLARARETQRRRPTSDGTSQ